MTNNPKLDPHLRKHDKHGVIVCFVLHLSIKFSPLEGTMVLPFPFISTVPPLILLGGFLLSPRPKRIIFNTSHFIMHSETTSVTHRSRCTSKFHSRKCIYYTRFPFCSHSTSNTDILCLFFVLSKRKDDNTVRCLTTDRF